MRGILGVLCDHTLLFLTPVTDLSVCQSTRGTCSLPLSVTRGDGLLHTPPSCQVYVGVGTSHDVLPAPHRRQRGVSEVSRSSDAPQHSNVSHHHANNILSCHVSSGQQPLSSPSTLSVTSSRTTPDRTCFPRGSSSRSTFHGAQLRDCRPATYNGPPASPGPSPHATTPPLRTSTSLIGKIASKFVRRSAVPSSQGPRGATITGRLAKMPGAARSFTFNCRLFVLQEFLR